MKITKYGHACLLIEDNGKRLLIDPGAFTFNDHFKPEQVGAVDVIVVTHSHMDHLSSDAMKTFMGLGSAIVVSGNEVKQLLEKEQVNVKVIDAGEEQEVAGFKIQAFPVAHEPMPFPAAENFAYLINGRLLHPGDSYVAEGLPNPEILALATQGPWGRVVDAIAYAKAMKPKIVIPMHNALLNDVMGPVFDNMICQQLQSQGIEPRQLAVGESVDL